MSAVQETAYPRFRTEISQHELDTVYTPTADERRWARQAKQPLQRFFLLLHLKAFQKLGYFMPSETLPVDLVRHVGHCLGLKKPPSKTQLKQYDRSGARNRHVGWIREYLGIRSLETKDRTWLANLALKAAESREVPADIINILLEELVRHRFELPGFSVLLRYAKEARAAINDRCYRALVSDLGRPGKGLINTLLTAPRGNTLSGWQRLKREPRKPTNKEIRSYLQHLKWLKGMADQLPTIQALPVAKRH
ncbi:DUF4158 domain-containing protein, partial [Marinobacteraceae bacterium S3BR75-40.1]